VKDPMHEPSYSVPALVNVSLGVEQLDQLLMRLVNTGRDSKISVRLSLVAFRGARLIRSCTSSGYAAPSGQSATRLDIGWQD
jgi:hypothetical protein